MAARRPWQKHRTTCAGAHQSIPGHLAPRWSEIRFLSRLHRVAGCSELQAAIASAMARRSTAQLDYSWRMRHYRRQTYRLDLFRQMVSSCFGMTPPGVVQKRSRCSAFSGVKNPLRVYTHQSRAAGQPRRPGQGQRRLRLAPWPKYLGEGARAARRSPARCLLE